MHHQKGMVIVLWDFTNLNWKISLFKLLYILEAITLKFNYFWLLPQQDKSKLTIHEFFCTYKFSGHICISSLGWAKDCGRDHICFLNVYTMRVYSQTRLLQLQGLDITCKFSKNYEILISYVSNQTTSKGKNKTNRHLKLSLVFFPLPINWL